MKGKRFRDSQGITESLFVGISSAFFLLYYIPFNRLAQPCPHFAMENYQKIEKIGEGKCIRKKKSEKHWADMHYAS